MLETSKAARKLFTVALGSWLVLQGPVDAFSQVLRGMPAPVPLAGSLELPSSAVSPQTPGSLSVPSIDALPSLAPLGGAAQGLQQPEGLSPLGEEKGLRSVEQSGILQFVPQIEKMGEGDARGAGEALQDRLEGLASPGGLEAAPEGSGVVEASRLSAELSYQKALWRSFWWYSTTRVLSYYDKYRRDAAKNPEPSVRDGKRFLADLRVMGVEGGFNALGFQNPSDAKIKSEAAGLYDRYVNAGPEARAAFHRFLERAETFNPGARRSYYKKQVRNALIEVASRPASSLAGYFDSLLAPGEKVRIDEYRRTRMDADRELFVSTVKQVLAETPAGGKGRPVAGIMLGSHASRVATPSSDFDLEVVTEDGRFDGVPSFIERLHQRWRENGGTAQLEVHSYAMPVSGWLLAGVHTEAKQVISLDPALTRLLESGRAARRGGRLSGLFFKWTHWALAHATMALADLGRSFRGADEAPKADSAFKPAEPARGPPALAKAKWGLILSRTPSIASFILTAIAFPMLAAATPGVGQAGLAKILAFGTVPMVAFGPVIGRLSDHVDLRKLMLVNSAMRVFIYGVSAALVFTGAANFAWLLGLSILNSINTVATITAEGSLVSHLWGKDPKENSNVNSLLQFNYLALQVVLGIGLKIGKAADVWGIGWTYAAGAALVLSANIPLIWAMIPKVSPSASFKDGHPVQGGFWAALASLLKEGAAILPKHWPQALLFAASVLSYSWLGSAIPIVGSLVVWIAGTETFKGLWKNPGLRNPMLFYGLLSLVFFPVQSLVVPMAAKLLAGGGAGGAMLGQLSGALYMGQLLATSTTMKMTPRHRLALVGAVGAGVGVWAYASIFPGSLPLAAGVAAATLGLAWLVSRFTDRSWVQFIGGGLAFVWLPYFHWGVSPLLLSVAMVGLFNSPLTSLLLSRFGTEADKTPEKRGALIGIQGAFMSALTGLGYAFFGAGLNHYEHPLPDGFKPLGWLFAAAGLVFAFAPMWLSGLSKKHFSKDGMQHHEHRDKGPEA